MFKTIIVDDEKNGQERLLSNLEDGSSMGLKLLGRRVMERRDYSLLKKLSPDIVITDMKNARDGWDGAAANSYRTFSSYSAYCSERL
ncbi:hypothetical protein GCM10020331_087070 [Ectobacillus funiculus]